MGVAENTKDSVLNVEALTSAYEYEIKAYEANRIETGSIYELGFATWEFVKTGMPEFQQKTIELHEILILLAPGDSMAKERLMILNKSVGQYSSNWGSSNLCTSSPVPA